MLEKLLNAMKSTNSKIFFAFSHRNRMHRIVPVQEPADNGLGWTEQQLTALRAFQPEINDFLSCINTIN